MSRVLLCLIGVLAISHYPLSHATDVYIVAGQSNGWRISSVSNFPNGPGLGSVIYFPMACASRPETTTLQSISSVHPSCQGKGLAEGLLKHSGADIIIVQYCVCGTSLHGRENWYPGDDPTAGESNDAGLFSKFLKYLADAKRQAEAAGHTWDVKALFWHQGESDANDHAVDYEKSFRHLLARFRKEVQADLPVVAGHIRELSDESRQVNRALDAVAAADPLTVIVPTADLASETPTDVHFNTVGCHALGARMAKAYADISSVRRGPKP